jgi:hypothetical protein
VGKKERGEMAGKKGWRGGGGERERETRETRETGRDRERGEREGEGERDRGGVQRRRAKGGRGGGYSGKKRSEETWKNTVWVNPRNEVVVNIIRGNVVPTLCIHFELQTYGIRGHCVQGIAFMQSKCRGGSPLIGSTTDGIIAAVLAGFVTAVVTMAMVVVMMVWQW